MFCTNCGKELSNQATACPGCGHPVGSIARAAPQGSKKEARAAVFSGLLHGSVKPEMIFPHCQVKGKVHTMKMKQKKGISGGKAVGAILTGGLSILATGLSRKEKGMQAHCDNCGATWNL